MREKNGLPSIGTSSDVLGTLSASINKKTVNASRTDIPALIFSPASGGTQNTETQNTQT